MLAVNYRRAHPGDGPMIAEFQISLARETEQIDLDRAVCAEGVRAVFEDPSKWLYYVGEADGRVVCSALVTYEWSDWRNGVIWWIHSVYVASELRGQGVFSGLYRYLQELASADPGVRGIRLYVDRRNTVAQRVYTNLGMDGGHYQVFEWMK
ncbi:MAG TPA: GNAT family N-acetyltransferase [Blastocatellia bacterium]|nr:GNAT family N-acetyltransferase [Blastocatellia bacterium]